MKTFAWAGLTLALIVSGCSANGTAAGIIFADAGPTPDKAPAVAPTDSTQFCRDYCARASGCDTSRDTQTCENACTNEQAATFPKLRTDVVKIVRDCFEQKDCKTVLASDVISTCKREAVASVAPSDDAVSLCGALGSAAAKCGRTSDKVSCLGTAKLYNDSTLKQALRCATKACADIDDCLSAALGVSSSTTITPGPAVPSCNAFMYDNGGSCDQCAKNLCASEVSACTDTQACTTLSCCSKLCTSTACKDACEQAYPSSVSAMQRAGDCVATRCYSYCSGSR